MNFGYKMTSTNKQTSLGFTIIELIITIALLSVMLAVAVPGFGNLYQNNNLATASNRFVSSISLARNEAISRNTDVIMCNINISNTGCANNGQWESGWVVWVDLDGDGIIENPNDAGDLEVIHREEAMPAGYTLRAATYSNIITFAPTGEASGDTTSQADTFRLCDASQSTDTSRSINFNAVGRAWVTTNPVTSCP